ncbi:MAG: DUF1059 domain-containing protein [Gaiellaceae bacterium]
MNAYTFTCRDSGLDCPGAFTTESKEELIEHLQLHAREAHQKYDLSRPRRRKASRYADTCRARPVPAPRRASERAAPGGSFKFGPRRSVDN